MTHDREPVVTKSLLRNVCTALALAILAPVLVAQPVDSAPVRLARPGDDVTVIAVIDAGITPVHWDYLASKMPQATDGDPRNDLPLDRPPHQWLRGFPNPERFAAYSSISLEFEESDGGASVEKVRRANRGPLGTVARSTSGKIRYHWLPGTKIIGALDFDGGGIDAPTTAHGTGASSVAVGNLHGSCPSCVLVFLDTGFAPEALDAAIRWAASQPWIDAISNSYGRNTAIGTNYTRDGIYLGETEFQKRASERGQTIFFAAHNGLERSFIIPTSPLLSSESGPDWVVTVGAVSARQDRSSYTGHGKPADISSLGSGYPSASGAGTVGGSGEFSGTSNATPVIAGMYGQALYEVRQALPGPSRVQRKGVVATGGFECGVVRQDCELADGRFTAAELRTRLFHGAVHTPAGMTVSGATPAIPPIGEDEFLNEGHGTFHGLIDGREVWREELRRIVLPVLGRSETLERPDGEREWMVADSFCRQHLWGSWSGGYYREGKSELPPASPHWPLRTAIVTACPLVDRP